MPDGNGEFAEAMGRLIDDSAIGFGKRSWRYSMLVDDGKIVKIFDEPQDSGSDDPYEVSDADTMIKYIDPNCKTNPLSQFLPSLVAHIVPKPKKR